MNKRRGGARRIAGTTGYILLVREVLHRPSDLRQLCTETLRRTTWEALTPEDSDLQKPSCQALELNSQLIPHGT